MKVENGHKTKLLTLLKASTRGGKKSYRQWFFVRFMKVKATESQNYLFFFLIPPVALLLKTLNVKPD